MQSKLDIRSDYADQFEDISHKQAIQFAYPSGGQIVINEPVGVHTAADGTMTFVSQDQTVTQLKPGWDICSWKVRAGEKHVVKSDVERHSAAS